MRAKVEFVITKIVIDCQQTVYQRGEVKVHSALKHKNILPLLAVLMGKKH